MGAADGFWSYVHRDDEHDRGRIVALAHDIVGEYEMLTGDRIDLFLDKDALEWGDRWKAKIDTSLASVAFFIPVLTPRYFLSSECLRELSFFANRANDLGLKDLVLPLHYVDVPALNAAEPDDELMKLLGQFQWEDWRELRNEAQESAAYRKPVNRLAQKLVTANRRAEVQSSGASVDFLGSENDPPDMESEGLIDKLADGEDAMPAMVKSLGGMSEVIGDIGGLMRQATAEVSASSSTDTFRRRATVAKRLAVKLEGPVSKLSRIGDEFVVQLAQVDITIRTILELVLAQERLSPEDATELQKFLMSVEQLAVGAGEALTRGAEFVDTVANLERMSRDLRPIFRRLRAALGKVVQGKATTDAWLSLVGSPEVAARMNPGSD